MGTSTIESPVPVRMIGAGGGVGVKVGSGVSVGNSVSDGTGVSVGPAGNVLVGTNVGVRVGISPMAFIADDATTQMTQSAIVPTIAIKMKLGLFVAGAWVVVDMGSSKLEMLRL